MRKGIITGIIFIIFGAIIVTSVLSLLKVSVWEPIPIEWISMSGIAIGTFIITLIWMNYLTSISKEEAKEIFLIKNVIDEIEEEIKELEITNVNKNSKIKKKLKVKISSLIEFSESVSKMVGKIDSLIWKDIKKKLEDLENEIQIDGSSCPQQFKQKKDKLFEKLELLKGYIVLISTTRLTSRDKLALLEEIDENIKDLKNRKDEESKKEIIKLRNRKIEVLSEEPVGVLDKHEIRRSLTISLTIVYFMLLFFTIFSPVTTTTQFINMTGMSPENITGNITVGNIDSIATKVNITSSNITFSDIILSRKTAHTTPNLESPFIEVFTYIYLAVIAFYFGSRVIETYITKKK